MPDAVGTTRFAYKTFILFCLVAAATLIGTPLFGFLYEEEKVLFEKLIGVSKVGPKMALAALSTFSPAELADAIASQDIARVSHIPGVGKKTAQPYCRATSSTL